MKKINVITEKVIGAAIEVHRHLGPGLLEGVYEECLSYELVLQGVRFERQQYLPVLYKGKQFENGFRTDLIVEGTVIVELKSVSSLSTLHEAQLLNYLRLAGLPVGLLINFNVSVLKDGIKRMVAGNL